MNILFIVPYTPTPIRTRPYNLLRGLTRRGHRVTLATLWQDEEERAALGRLAEEGIRVIAAHLPRGRALWNCLRGLPTGQPLQAHYCWSPSLARALGFEIRDSRFDVIHVEHLRGARYGLYLKSLIPNPQSPAPNPQPPIPVIWDSVDCISYLFEQAAARSGSLFGRRITRLELGRTRRYEGWLVGQFDRVLVTSEVDKAALEELANRQSLIPNTRYPISVLPNGVDLAYFCPDDTARDPATVVFTGKMSYHANVTAALHLVHDIMPLVWQERPEVRVIIAGKDPPGEITRLQSPTPDPQSPTPSPQPPTPNPRIIVTGAVPDLRPYLRRATVVAAPMVYGAGIQNKVLEAMACAAPVVASRRAVAALQAADGEQLLVADDAEGFARCVLRLLGDPELTRRLAAAGRRYVEQHHDWDGIVERLEAIYQTSACGRAT